jgi:hypothetical protein
VINIDQLRSHFIFVANVPQQGYISPARFNNIALLATNGLFLQRLGYPEQAEFQTAIPKISYHRTSKIHYDLNPFRKSTPLVVLNNQTPISQIPADLCIPTNLKYEVIVLDKDSKTKKALKRCGCLEVDTITNAGSIYKKIVGDIDLVEEDKWSNRVSSSVVNSACYCPLNDRYDFFFPVTGIQKVILTYLARPAVPIWNYDIVNNVPKYNPIGSVDLEWDATLLDAIVERMVKIYSKSTSDSFGVQFSDTKIKAGE